ncbi:MAG: DUF427 domain-containing protein [Pseudonocardiaceae bacterium]
MMRAVWNGVVLAEAPRTVRVEGNHYFPAESLRTEHLVDSSTTTVCPWKGQAHYYTVRVDGQTNPDAAWYYPKPSRLARKISDHVAFGNGVQVEGETEGEAGGLLGRLRGRREGRS